MWIDRQMVLQMNIRGGCHVNSLLMFHCTCPLSIIIWFVPGKKNIADF